MAIHGLLWLNWARKDVQFLTRILCGESYENNSAFRDFIQKATECLFQEDLEKLKQADFISVLCDGSMDAAIVEKELKNQYLKMQMDYMMQWKDFLFFSSYETAVYSSLNVGIIAKFKELYN